MYMFITPDVPRIPPPLAASPYYRIDRQIAFFVDLCVTLPLSLEVPSPTSQPSIRPEVTHFFFVYVVLWCSDVCGVFLFIGVAINFAHAVASVKENDSIGLIP